MQAVRINRGSPHRQSIVWGRFRRFGKASVAPLPTAVGGSSDCTGVRWPPPTPLLDERQSLFVCAGGTMCRVLQRESVEDGTGETIVGALTLSESGESIALIVDREDDGPPNPH